MAQKVGPYGSQKPDGMIRIEEEMGFNARVSGKADSTFRWVYGSPMTASQVWPRLTFFTWLYLTYTHSNIRLVVEDYGLKSRYRRIAGGLCGVDNL